MQCAQGRKYWIVKSVQKRDAEKHLRECSVFDLSVPHIRHPERTDHRTGAVWLISVAVIFVREIVPSTPSSPCRLKQDGAHRLAGWINTVAVQNSIAIPCTRDEKKMCEIQPILLVCSGSGGDFPWKRTRRSDPSRRYTGLKVCAFDEIEHRKAANLTCVSSSEH